MNKTIKPLPSGDFTLESKLPFTVELGLGHDGSIGVYNDEYTRTYVDRDALIEKLRGMKGHMPHHLEDPKLFRVMAGYNTAIDDIIKLLEAK